MGVLAHQRAAWGIKVDRPFTREEKKTWSQEERKMYKCFELHGKEEGWKMMRAYMRDKKEVSGGVGGAAGASSKEPPSAEGDLPRAAPATAASTSAQVDEEDSGKDSAGEAQKISTQDRSEGKKPSEQP